MIGTGLGYDDISDKEQVVTLYKDENSTVYRGEFTLEEDNYVNGCDIYSVQDNESLDVKCDRYEDYKVNISMNNGDSDEVIGHWNNENQTVYLDSGTDYGEELRFDVNYYSEDDYDFFMILGDISSATCCLGLLLSIVFLIVGFSQGKPGMGWGGATALVSLPVVSFISLVLMW
tara:strand:+ start:34 stop:555 length:522 start_codon:yes stop_codon:yes gene_type:complete